MTSSKDVVDDFCSSLCDLTVNSKPHINMLTMLAEDYKQDAPAIVQAVEDHLAKVPGDVKLPVLYLIDSILKNVGDTYIALFSKNIVNTFTQAFSLVDEKSRGQMYKLRMTWMTLFNEAKLFALDTKVSKIDPAWPITAEPTPSAPHFNPKFLVNPPGSPDQELLKQKKELMELQKRKLELEILQTKAILEGQQKRASAPTKESKNKIPPVSVIITKPASLAALLPEALKPKPTSVAAHVAPVRIRDPRLRVKEPSNEPVTSTSEVKSPPRAVLSPVPSPSNNQSSSSSESPTKHSKKEKKSKKHKESRSKSKNEENPRDKSDKPAKLSRAEEVLRNLEEEQRLSKMQKFGSETVINKAKRHEEMMHPKIRSKDSPTKLKRVSSPAKVTSSPSEHLRERTPEPPPPPIISRINQTTNSSSARPNEPTALPPSPPPAPHIESFRAAALPRELVPSNQSQIATALPKEPTQITDSVKNMALPEDTDSNVVSVKNTALPAEPATHLKVFEATTLPRDPAIVSSIESVALPTKERSSATKCVASPKETVIIPLTPSVHTRSKGSVHDLVSVIFKGLAGPPAKNKDVTVAPINVSAGQVLAIAKESVTTQAKQSDAPRLVQSVSQPTEELASIPASAPSSPLTDPGTCPSKVVPVATTGSSFREEQLSSREESNTFEETPNKTPQIASSRKSKSKSPTPPPVWRLKTKRKREHSPPAESCSKIPSNASPEHVESPSSNTIPASEVLLDSGQDTDLRMLTKELDSSAKKAKTENLDDLFGKEDVDLRALPPPPPIISQLSSPRRSSRSPQSSPSRRSRSPQSCSRRSRSPERSQPSDPQKGWANLKRSNSESSPAIAKRSKKFPRERRKSDRFNYNDDEPSLDDPECEERERQRQEIIMRQAQEQLRSGNLTFNQYNNLLKEVIIQSEKRKVSEAVKREQYAASAEHLDYNHVTSSSSETIKHEQHDVTEEHIGYNNGNTPISTKCEPVEAPGVDLRRQFAEQGFSPNNDEENKILHDRALTMHDRCVPDAGERSDYPLIDNQPNDFRRFPNNRNQERMMLEHNRNVPTNKGPRWIGPPSVRGGTVWVRNEFGRLIPPPPSMPPNLQFRHQLNFRHPIIPHMVIPPADPAVLDMIANDPMKMINIDAKPREIRFYGDTAIIMMAPDDPREVSFQPSQRLVKFPRSEYLCHFNAPYIDVRVEGLHCQIRLGAPTRELYVDGKFYEGIFDNHSIIDVRIGNRLFPVRLDSPFPNVKIGIVPRRDLVAGKISLIIDGTDIVPIYLDAKPQIFQIDGVPYILRFVEALQTVVINGVPFKFVYGGEPVPLFFRGKRHYLRFSSLPRGVKPGFVNIVNMEGGRLPSPPPLLPPPPPMMMSDSVLSPPPSLPAPLLPNPPEMMVANLLPPPGDINHPRPPIPPPPSLPVENQPLELLANLPVAFDAGIGQCYSVEENSNHASETSAIPLSTVTSTTSEPTLSLNLSELWNKLVAVGIVPGNNKKEELKPEIVVDTEIIPVSFDRPESLKTKQPGLVHLLYSGMQCSTCGVRFPPEQTGKYSQHLDWHFRQNRRERDAIRTAQSRRWNYDVSDWIQYQEIEEKEDRAQSWFEIQEKRNFETEEVVEDVPSVPAGEQREDASCKICHDKFDQFYNEEKEEWHLRQAVEVDGKLYHPLCHKEREERRKAQNDAVAAAMQDGDNEVIIIPTAEPETIEIPDDTIASDATVLGIPMDDSEKVELIDLDSEPSNSKDGPDDEALKEENDHQSDDDDDILQIEVLENKIETVDLSDEEFRKEEKRVREEDDGNEDIAEAAEKDDSREPTNDVLEVDLSKVKKEKIEVVDLDAQTSQPHVVSSIDGNVELEDAGPVSLPKRIKINIASAIVKPPKPAEAPKDQPPGTSPPPDFAPLSPTAVQYPQNVKQRLTEAELNALPPVNKGSELSGLCSIM